MTEVKFWVSFLVMNAALSKTGLAAVMSMVDGN